MSKLERPLWWAAVLVVILSLTRCSAAADCGGDLTEQAGVILSPNFPNGYPPNQRCHWTITVEKNQVITLRFQHLDLERYGALNCIDYLQLYNGPSTQSPVLGNRVCGNKTESAVTDIRFRSSGHQMHLYFYSGISGTRPGFSASYIAHKCPSFSYGRDECDQPCSCDQENSVYCLSHNGTCVCKDGWTSSNCTTDINECENPNACTDLYSECHNLLGSYECKCRPGMSNNTFGVCEDTHQCTVKNCSHACGVLSTNPHVEECYCPRGMKLDPYNLTCIACSDWTFGKDCANTSACHQRNTRTYDKTNGLCNCYLNWTSTDCTQHVNVNECGIKNPCTNSACRDLWNSFECQCYYGYEKVTNETTCEECGRVITQPEGIIDSPYFYQYPSGHPPFQECNWTIETDKRNVISFSFKMFQLQSSATHPAYVEVYDGRNSSFKMLGNYSGDVYNNGFLPGMIRSSGNELFIALYSSFNYSLNDVRHYWTRGFSAKYWTHECNDFMYDDSCTTPCTCVQNNTEYCNSTNGHCVCKKEWTSHNCSVVVNECYENPFSCPDYSICKNLFGSFECTCQPGLILDSKGNCVLQGGGTGCTQRQCSHVCVKTALNGQASLVEQCYCPIGMELDGDQCVECKNNTYGPECYRQCTCVPGHTDGCDTRSGNCTCLQGWTSDNCSEDINECELDTDVCVPYSDCTNTQGSFDCTCRYSDGYEKSSNGSCVKIDCSHNFSNASGIISSPDYPSTYYNNAFCTWSITANDGDVVSLRFETFNIEKRYDTVEVYDGSSENARIIGIYQGNGAPEIIRSTGNSMYITFVSDLSRTYAGFTGIYTSHPCPVDTYGDESCNNTCSCVKDKTQFCNNINGQCVCKHGWRGYDCSEDVDECLGVNACPQGSKCSNSPGSYTCYCTPGYIYNSTSSSCDPIQECQTKQCSHACYINSLQEEECTCPEGLVLDQIDKLTCAVPLYPADTSATSLQMDKNTNKNIVVSNKLNFSSDVPFGVTRQPSAWVLSNGAIVFERNLTMVPGTVDLMYVFSIGLKIVAPFWTETDSSKGEVFYSLYEKCESSIFSENGNQASRSSVKDEVMKRAEKDVVQFHDLTGFEVNTALVVTWKDIQPFISYSTTPEKNTFQAIYISGWEKKTVRGVETFSDEETAYVVYIYPHRLMNWNFKPGRRVSVGYTSVKVELVKDFDTQLVSKVNGNTGYRGVMSFQVGKTGGPEQKWNRYLCNHASLLSNKIYKYEIQELYKCPSTLERLGLQWRLYDIRGEDRDIYCYAISSIAKRRLLQTNRRNKLCCYRWKKPDRGDWKVWLVTQRAASYVQGLPESGHVLINDPWSSSLFDSYQAEENIRAHQWCCKDSFKAKYCERFLKIFPDMGFSIFVIFETGFGLGDPHITTLDGVSYTMNGWGEYTMMDIPSKEFRLQARSGRAETSDGRLTNATVFTAFVARESSQASFQVELSYSKTSMVIQANRVDLTENFYRDQDQDYGWGSSSIRVRREFRDNETMVVAEFPCGVSIKVYVAVQSLVIELEVDKNLRGKTSGLFGNFNGNMDDEFTLPNGRILASDLSERNLYEKFAKEWAITKDQSVFTYESGETAADYQHPDFVPFYRDEADPSALAKAKEVCGDTNDPCIFDYLVTQNKVFAESTKQSQEKQVATIKALYNTLPSVKVTSDMVNRITKRLMVNSGQQTTVQVIGEDQDGDSVTFELFGNSYGTVTESGIINFTPDVNRPSTISVRALDSRGGYSSIEQIPLTVCPDCSGHGQCDYSVTRPVEYENGNFQILACKCHPAYTGEDCELELDACTYHPCSQGQQCTDLTAEQQGDSSVGYECGPCPDGFFEFRGRCADINECEDDSLCPQLCINTEGSYQCGCRLGYRLDQTDMKSCIDINECEERQADCQQLCVNTDGSYTCDCRDSYILNADGVTCSIDAGSPASCQKCEQVCVLNSGGETSCACHTGYEINPKDSTACIDIDECKKGNSPCSQLCSNTVGKFECSCYAGYNLSTDGLSCIPCRESYYGRDCANICQCSGRGTCDPVRGCICNDQWKGENCDVDVNECDQPAACGSEFVCRNEMGSYRCECLDGYQMEDGLCKDFDECSHYEFSKNCDFNLENCINNVGSYSCECKQGYARKMDGQCHDINECESSSDDCEQVCENVPGSFNCKCYNGYKLADDRKTCRKDVNKDPCQGYDLNCSHVCAVDDNNSPFCICPRGYQLLGTNQCEDINECASDQSNQCTNKSLCVNTNGSYSCSCPPGTKLDNDGRSCVACKGETWGMGCVNSCACGSGADHCDAVLGCVCRDGFTGMHCSIDIDECERGEHNCQTENGEKCINTPGSFTCGCRNGFVGNFTGSCTDFDPCNDTSKNNCDQVCSSHDGGFSCSCYPGYFYNKESNTCTDTNECDAGNNQCEGICINTEGSYRCSCTRGLKLKPDGFSCEAIQPCPTKQSCSHGCALIDQTETCLCPRGLKLSTDGQTCQDVDLCETSPCVGGCMEIKANTSFECLCGVGQLLASDGITCTGCIEGKWGSGCLNDCSCLVFNTKSCDKVTGTCLCKDGWEGASCQTDIDECQTDSNICPVNSHCLNLNGTSSCICDDGFVKKNLETGICQECDNSYGPLCAQRCSCGRNFDCDRVDGHCYCSKGWKGSNCDMDINECDENIHDCDFGKHEMCQNDIGGFHCVCAMGYHRLCDSCECQEIHVVSVSMTFVIDVSSLELEDRNSDDYKRIKNQLEQMIETQLKKTEVPVVSVNVSDLTALGNGRLKCDCAVALTMDKGKDPDKTVTLPLLSFFTDEKVAVDGKSASVDIFKVGDQQYAASDSPCVIKQKSDPCSDECEEKDGMAVCKSESEKEKDDLLVKLGLGLGIPAFCLLCVVIGTIVYCCIKKRNEKRHF